MKSVKTTKQWHTPKTKTGMGAYQGTGIKNPVGRIIDVMGLGKVNQKKMGKPPKSLA